MAGIVTGTFIDRNTGRGVPGLSVELRHQARVVARAPTATEEDGRFRIEISDPPTRPGGDDAATLTLVVRSADGAEVQLPHALTVAWPLERERVEFDVKLDVPDQPRRSILIGVLHDVLDGGIPDAVREGLRRARIDTLVDVRAAGGLGRLEGLAPEDRRVVHTLESHARLEVIAADAGTAARLIAAGVTSVTRLARADAVTLAERTGIEPAAVRDLIVRARTHRWLIDNDLIGAIVGSAPSNRIHRVQEGLIEGKHWAASLLTREPDPDACRSCITCASGVGPAAYLVDLIDFLIDNFKEQVVQTASPVAPKGFAALGAIEERLYRPLRSLVVDCEAGDDPVCQIEIAIGVLERFVMRAAAKSREDIYAAFPFKLNGKPRFPHPDVLSRMFDAYLAELGVARDTFDAAIEEAYPTSNAPADKTRLDVLLDRLGTTEAKLKTGLDLAASWEPHVRALAWMPDLVRTAMAKGIDSDDVTQLASYRDALARADNIMARVKDATLPGIRGNLISYALRPLMGNNLRNPAITNARQLGDHLHIDLETTCCARTTRLASAIEAIQSWVEAFRIGREDAGYYLNFAGGLPEGNFDARWRWLRSYATWQAAQWVLLYPENFLIPSLRKNMSPPFDALLDDLDRAGTDDGLIAEAVEKFRQAIAVGLADVSWFPAHPTPSQGIGLSVYASAQSKAYGQLAPGTPLWNALDEWYLYLPLAVAEHLNHEGAHERAAAWLHNVFYPFAASTPPDFPFPPVRLVWPGFSREGDYEFAYRNTIEWLTDPFDPFAVAGARRAAFLRHVIAQYAENLLDWADGEFARDTAETVARARELYELADTLLAAPELPPEDACRAAWLDLLAQIAETHSPDQTRLLLVLLDPLAKMSGRLKRTDLTRASEILREDEAFEERLDAIRQLVKDVASRPMPGKTVGDLLREQRECQLPELRSEDVYNRGPRELRGIVLPEAFVPSREAPLAAGTLRRIGCGFCVPPNPALTALRFRTTANVDKIRSCRNIAGLRRSVQAYAPGADPLRAVQAAGSGADIEETIPNEPPPIHRFSYLIERARYYAEVARQLESQLLNAFEREDAEKYTLLKARQDVGVARANLTLQGLRVNEANDGVTLAQLQRDRAADQKRHFDALLQYGLLDYEKEAVTRLWAAHDWTIAATAVGGVAAIGGAVAGAIIGAPGGPPGSTAGAVVGGIAGALAGGGQVMQGIANVQSIASQARSMQAEFERRQQDWELQSRLADWDRRIGAQSVTLANDNVVIATQEQEVARLQSQHASDVVEFLGNKFTNVELWRWMATVLRRYYRDHLTFATVTARMAQRALEFERQETIPLIAPVYAARQKRDLLAAEQLLTDINKLDQHRLTTEHRRKELTKTISLAQLDPIGFNALRQGDGMRFATLLDLFDRDFPGHYLRLIKSVSLTVVALVPPHESVHATLSNVGVSRVIVGPPFDEPRVIQRQPESIAVTAANNGTGLFELRLDDPILLPFEGAGVETMWTLDLPRGANRFDLGTLADVLFTVRYTALEDAAYRDKALKRMGMTADRTLRVDGATSFPLRASAPDEWFDLHHPQFVAVVGDYGFGPGKVKPPYLMQFDLRPGDFPPNEVDHGMRRLNIAFRQRRPVPVPVEIWFNPVGTTEEYTADANYTWDPDDPNTGPISVSAFTHRLANGAAGWQPVDTPLDQLAPFGVWRLRLRNEDADAVLIDRQQYNQNVLTLEWLEDALFVVAYDANTTYRFAS